MVLSVAGAAGAGEVVTVVTGVAEAVVLVGTREEGVALLVHRVVIMKSFCQFRLRLTEVYKTDEQI